MKGIIIPLFLVLIIGSAVVPLPTPVLDGLIIGNILLALFLLVGSFSVADPTQFSTLPAVVLLGVVSRLLVTISTTRAILTHGDAGVIVAAFGSIMVNDDLLVGCILFGIISIIQFLVVSKGSERVAEVSARFALDALPGRQMSLDADLRSGLLDPIMAQQRRQELQVESRLYGALDGAMKFIKGDTIATICITFVNIAGGIISGTVRDGMPIIEALRTYTVLSIGDGLVGQIPSLLTCVAAGILVTRVPRCDAVTADADILEQLGSLPKARVVTALGAALLAFIPGMPTFTCLLLALPFGLSALLVKSRNEQTAPPPASFSPSPLALISVNAVVSPESQSITAAHVVGSIDRVRQSIFDRIGIVLPPFSLSLVAAPAGAPTEMRASLEGIPVISVNPTPEDADPLAEFASKLEDMLVKELPTLLDDTMTRTLLDLHSSQYGELIGLLVPAQISVSQLTQLLRDLITEGVSIRSFDRLLQTIGEKFSVVGPGRILLEEARLALRRSIVQPFLALDRKPSFLGVSPELDGILLHAERSGGLPPISVASAITTFCQNRGAAEPIDGIVVGRGARALVRDILWHGGLVVPVYAREELNGISYQMEETLVIDDESDVKEWRDTERGYRPAAPFTVESLAH